MTAPVETIGLRVVAEAVLVPRISTAIDAVACAVGAENPADTDPAAPASA